MHDRDVQKAEAGHFGAYLQYNRTNRSKGEAMKDSFEGNSAFADRIN